MKQPITEKSFSEAYQQLLKQVQCYLQVTEFKQSHIAQLETIGRAAECLRDYFLFTPNENSDHLINLAAQLHQVVAKLHQTIFFPNQVSGIETKLSKFNHMKKNIKRNKLQGFVKKSNNTFPLTLYQFLIKFPNKIRELFSIIDQKEMLINEEYAKSPFYKFDYPGYISWYKNFFIGIINQKNLKERMSELLENKNFNSKNNEPVINEIEKIINFVGNYSPLFINFPGQSHLDCN